MINIYQKYEFNNKKTFYTYSFKNSMSILLLRKTRKNNITKTLYGVIVCCGVVMVQNGD